MVSGDCALPTGFDAPPRNAAQAAVENVGVPVIANISGWGGNLNENELQIVKICEAATRGAEKAALRREGHVGGWNDAIDVATVLLKDLGYPTQAREIQKRKKG